MCSIIHTYIGIPYINTRRHNFETFYSCARLDAVRTSLLLIPFQIRLRYETVNCLWAVLCDIL